jgi:hypothetical protein
MKTLPYVKYHSTFAGKLQRRTLQQKRIARDVGRGEMRGAMSGYDKRYARRISQAISHLFLLCATPRQTTSPERPAEQREHKLQFVRHIDIFR